MAAASVGGEVAAAVPVYNPLHSWNYFTLEFGYDLPEGGWSSPRRTPLPL